MFCPKCRQTIDAHDKYCRTCGHIFATFDKNAKVRNAAMILLAIGVSIAVLICGISIGAYGKVYFFDGYKITKIAWIIAIGCAVC